MVTVTLALSLWLCAAVVFAATEPAGERHPRAARVGCIATGIVLAGSLLAHLEGATHGEPPPVAALLTLLGSIALGAALFGRHHQLAVLFRPARSRRVTPRRD